MKKIPVLLYRLLYLLEFMIIIFIYDYKEILLPFIISILIIHTILIIYFYINKDIYGKDKYFDLLSSTGFVWVLGLAIKVYIFN